MIRGLIALVLFLNAADAQQIATGSLLVATPKSHDPLLGQSVVLLVHYDPDGAMGLIVNRRTGTAHLGGPIALGIRTLFRSPVKPAHAEHITGDIYILPGQGPIPPGATDHRVYDGYTGWSLQQLKDELSRQLWKIAPGDAAKIVFDPDPDTLWRRLLR
jgi:putative transcriptional regulator